MREYDYYHNIVHKMADTCFFKFVVMHVRQGFQGSHSFPII